MAEKPVDMIVPLLQAIREDIKRLDKQVDNLKQQVGDLSSEIKATKMELKAEIKGIKLNGIAEVYKANLTVAQFAELDTRLSRVERKVFPEAS